MYWICFMALMFIAVAIGFTAMCVVGGKYGFYAGTLIYFIIAFSVMGIGYYPLQDFFAEDIELEKNELECENICESQGLEFVDYISKECLCREQKFTLVNGGAT